MHILHTFSRRIIVCLGIVLCTVFVMGTSFAACYSSLSTAKTRCKTAKGSDCITVASDTTSVEYLRCTSFCYQTTSTTVVGSTVAKYTIYCNACPSQYELVYGGKGCYFTTNRTKYCTSGSSSTTSGCNTKTPKTISSSYSSYASYSVEWGAATDTTDVNKYNGTLSSMCSSSFACSCKSTCYGSPLASGTSCTGCNTCPSYASCSGGTSFSCNTGYYKNSSSCSRCPQLDGSYGTTSTSGQTDVTACYATAGTYTDSIGTYSLSGNCPYCSNVCSSDSDCSSVGTDYTCQDGCCKKDTSISCEHGSCSSDSDCLLPRYPSCFKGCCTAMSITIFCVAGTSCENDFDCGGSSQGTCAESPSGDKSCLCLGGFEPKL